VHSHNRSSDRHNCYLEQTVPHIVDKFCPKIIMAVFYLHRKVPIIITHLHP